LQHKFSISKSVKRQEIRDQLNDQILRFIKTFDDEIDAESLWLSLRVNGYKLSQSSFNARLREIVEAGFVTKRSIGYNKHFYLATGELDT